MANGNTVASIDVTLGSIYEVDTSTTITADVYSNTSTYSVGDYVIYAKFLYKCKTEISEPEDFDAEKWDKVKLANDVEALSAEVDGKADADSVYTKSEVDTALADKADKSTTYTKSETDTLLNAKANASDVYAKTDVDTLLNAKADANNTYTKTEVDTALQSKADANNVYSKSEVYTKTETDTALANKADSSSVYTKDEVYNKTQVDTIIDNLPEPMIFKGTLGEEGTITDLPSAGSSNEGFTYKVITAGTYASIVAKVGDVFVSNGSEWVLIPAGDTDSDSWRNIKVNGVEKLGSAISSGAVDFADTTNIKASFDPSGNKVQFTLDGVYTSSEVDTALSAKANSADVYTKTETYSKTEVYNKTETYNKAEVDSKVGNPEFTKSFSPTPIATLTNGAENAPMKSLVVDIVPKQASGTPTPSSPLPISGTDEFVITHTGKNLVFSKIDATVDASGTIISSTNYYKFCIAKVAQGQTYTVTTSDTSLVCGFFYDVPEVGDTTYNGSRIVDTQSKTFVAPITGYVGFRAIYDGNYQCEAGSTATPYEPYTATTHTIALPSTVYGGEVDVVSGSGTETRWYKKVKWNEGTNTTVLGDYTRKLFALPSSGYNVYPPHAGTPQICSVAPYMAVFNSDTLHFYVNANSCVLVLPNDTDGDLEIEFTGELATPTPITTTPTTIKTKGGTESIWSDAGDVSGEYYTEQVDDIIDLIDDAIEDAKELPDVTSADEGKKLVVTSSGTWIADYDRYANKQICGYLNTWSASGIIYRTVVTDLSFSKSGNDAKTSTAITGVNVSRIVGIHCVIKDTVSGSSPVYYIPVGSKTTNGSNTTMNISATTTLLGVYVTVEEDGDNASGYSADVIIEYTLAST